MGPNRLVEPSNGSSNPQTAVEEIEDTCRPCVLALKMSDAFLFGLELWVGEAEQIRTLFEYLT